MLCSIRLFHTRVGLIAGPSFSLETSTGPFNHRIPILLLLLDSLEVAEIP